MTEHHIDISQELWQDDDTERFDNETFHHLLIEQYKIYVEMADRISYRRMFTNGFFLTIHAVILGMVGLSLSHTPYIPKIGLLAFPLLGLLILCYAWWRLVQYFRRVSGAKAQVINELEKRLPARAASTAELKAMMRDRPYNSLRRIELFLPFVFALLYIFCFVYAVVMH